VHRSGVAQDDLKG